MTDLTHAELVEKVLATIDPHAKARDSLGYTIGGEEYARKVARAAIATIAEALKEPTEAMEEACALEINDYLDAGGVTVADIIRVTLLASPLYEEGK